MSGILIPAIACIVVAMVMFGVPALTVIAVRFFKLKERELTLEMEARDRLDTRQDALEDRVRRLEDVLSELDRDVRERLGIQGPPATKASRAELFEGSATAEEGPREIPRPIRSR